MSKVSKKKLLSPTVQHPAARWAFVLVLCAALGIVASYYWRVFYGLDARGLAPLAVTGFCVGLSILAGTAALLCTPSADALGRRRTGWLSVFGLVYAVGAMTAMYITYTPVGMVRIVGLQTRYFLPVWLLAVLAAAALTRRALAPRLTAEKAAAISVRLCGWYAFAGAVLLFQHYFVGPVYTIHK